MQRHCVLAATRKIKSFDKKEYVVVTSGDLN